MQWLEWDRGVPTVPAEMAHLARQRFGLACCLFGL
jgi:hypothetical protein